MLTDQVNSLWRMRRRSVDVVGCSS